MTTVFVEQPLAKAVGLLNIQAIFKNGSVQYEPIQWKDNNRMWNQFIYKLI